MEEDQPEWRLTKAEVRLEEGLTKADVRPEEGLTKADVSGQEYSGSLHQYGNFVDTPYQQSFNDPQPESAHREYHILYDPLTQTIQEDYCNIQQDDNPYQQISDDIEPPQNTDYQEYHPHTLTKHILDIGSSSMKSEPMERNKNIGCDSMNRLNIMRILCTVG